MALTSEMQNSSSLFSPNKSELNIREQSTEDFFDILRGLNIVEPSSLSKDDLTNIIRRIDDYNGLFTTQQLKNIKYKNFSEHVFFDSAVNKVSYAFDRIANIPYDKDELENIKFKNKTDGYTSHLIKNIYPNSLGSVNFSGSERVVVYDQKGRILNDISKNERKVGSLSPDRQKFSFDFWLKVPNGAISGNQIVFKKFVTKNNISNGFICYVSDSADAEKFKINLLLMIDNKYSLSSCTSTKNEWSHFTLSVNEEEGFKKTTFLINGNIVEESDIDRSGQGIKHTSFSDDIKSLSVPFVLGGVFVPNDQNSSAANSLIVSLSGQNITFSSFIGKIDEFRYFGKIRSNSIIKNFMHRNIYAQKGLKLYLRMNEPAGSYTNSCLIIDYSGNKLHGLVYSVDNQDNFSVTSDTTNFKDNSDTPLLNEIKSDSPVLNAGYTKIQEIRSKLTAIAKEYDENNPNLIFNLMPKHYFLNASDFQNLPVFSNDSNYTYPKSVISSDGFKPETDGTSLGSSIPANNELVNIVLIWARFFDQLKLYISSINNFLNIDYDAINEESIVGMQIPILCKMYGIKFKEILPNASKQKLNNFNLNYKDIISDIGIRKIQNILWQRFLINTQDFLKSKGTIKSIENTFNAFGIEYNKFIDIKEYATFNDIKLDNNFYVSEYKTNFLNFGNSKELSVEPTFIDNSIDDFSSNKTFLSIENIRTHADTTKGVGNNIFSGLSENWSIELFFAFKEAIKNKNFQNQTSLRYGTKQCLYRIDCGADKNPGLLVYFENYSNTKKDLGKLTVHVQPIKNNPNYNATIEILDVNIYDLPKYFCLTQKINYQDNSITYDLYLSDIGNQIKLKRQQKTTKVIKDITVRDENDNITKNLQQITQVDLNQTFFKNSTHLNVGSYNYSGNGLLSHIVTGNEDTNFEGQIIKIRAWKKALTENEKLKHSENIENYGSDISVNNLRDNIVFDFDFKNIQSTRQEVDNIAIFTARNNAIVYSDAEYNDLINNCKIKSRDISNNALFNVESIIIKKQNINIDAPVKTNRVNIISYENSENKVATNNYNFFPAHTMPIDFNYDNVSRVSVDMSIVKSVNDDISNLVADLNNFTYKLTNYYSKYDYSYKDIESLRRDYFEKFSDSILINYSSVGNVFKFFDNIMSSILYDIVPSSVRFEGFNYVYESHILERHKYQYKNSNSSVAINDLANSASFSRETRNFRRNINYNANRKLI